MDDTHPNNPLLRVYHFIIALAAFQNKFLNIFRPSMPSEPVAFVGRMFVSPTHQHSPPQILHRSL